jgi:hypothetical protein
MASAYFGLNRGQSGRTSIAGTSPVTESASASGSTDVEIRVDLTKSLEISEIYQLVERIQEWIMENRSKFLTQNN